MLIRALQHKPCKIMFQTISCFFVKELSQTLAKKDTFITRQDLKLVFVIFYQIFIFSPNDRPFKTKKNVVYFIEKALFILEIFNFS